MLTSSLASPFGLIYPEAAAPLGVVTNEVTMELGRMPTIDASGMHGANRLAGVGVVGLAGILTWSILGAAAAGGMAMLMSWAVRSKHPMRNPFLVGAVSALAGNLVMGSLALIALRAAA